MSELLYNGDCLVGMDKLIEQGVKVDLTVTSPPYDNLRSYEDSLEWNENIWKQVIKKLYEITKDGGVVVWVVGDATIKGSETATSFKQALYFMECGFNLHDTMIWEKCGAGAVGSNLCYWQNFEYMFVFSKGKINKPSLICDRPNKSIGVKGTAGGRDKNGKSRTKRKIVSKPLGRRFNVWNIPQETKINHPAPYPEKIANDHILSWSKENDVVFDPFMGSGTTGKMAKLNNRNFIGIEKVKGYFEIAEKRIKGVK